MDTTLDDFLPASPTNPLQATANRAFVQSDRGIVKFYIGESVTVLGVADVPLMPWNHGVQLLGRDGACDWHAFTPVAK